jgi:hypothetical protein
MNSYFNQLLDFQFFKLKVLIIFTFNNHYRWDKYPNLMSDRMSLGQFYGHPTTELRWKWDLCFIEEHCVNHLNMAKSRYLTLKNPSFDDKKKTCEYYLYLS